MNKGIRFMLLLALTIGVLLPACERNADPTTIATLDSMLVHVDSLKGATNNIDVGLLRHIDSTFQGKRGALDALLQDTLERRAAILVGNYYRAMVKTLPRVMDQYDQVRTELDTAHTKLTALRHDVDRGLLAEEPKRTYLRQEELVLKELYRSSDILTSSYDAVLLAHAGAPRIDSLLHSAVAPAP